MAGPITWRNVTGPDSSEAIRGMDAAGRNMSGAFDSFQNIITQRQAANSKAAALTEETAKQSILSTLHGAKTEADLDAYEASGAFQQSMSGLRPETIAALRGAPEAQRASIRAGVTAGQEFGDKQSTRAEIPILDQIEQKKAAGDFEGARLLAEQSNLRQKGAAIESIRTAGRTRGAEGRVDELAIPIHEAALRGHRETAELADQTHQNKKASLTLSGITTEDNTTAAIETRNVNAITNRYLAASQGENEGFTQRQAAIAAQHGVSVEDITSGRILDTMPTPELASLQAALRDNNALEPPSSTQRQAGLRKALLDGGVKVTAADAAVKASEASQNVNPTMSAEDAAAESVLTSSVAQRFQKMRDGNVFYQNPETRMEDQSAVFENINKAVFDGPDTSGRIRAMVGTWMDKGVRVIEGGKEVYHKLPPKAALKLFNQTVDQNSYVWNSTTGDMEDAAKAFVLSEEGRRLAKEADSLNADMELKETNKVKKEYKERVGAAPKTSVADSLDRTIRGRAAQAKQREEAQKAADAAAKDKASRPPSVEELNEMMRNMGRQNSTGMR